MPVCLCLCQNCGCWWKSHVDSKKSRYPLIWIILEHILNKQCSCWARPAITCFRRYNILAALNCPAQQSKEMLREEADLLQRHDRNLFGKKFSEHLVFSAKSKKQNIKIFAEKGKKKQKPFRNGPSEAPRRSSGGQHSKFFLDKRYGQKQWIPR